MLFLTVFRSQREPKESKLDAKPGKTLSRNDLMNDLDLAAYRIRWLLEAATDEVEAAFIEGDEDNLQRLRSKATAILEATLNQSTTLIAFIEANFTKLAGPDGAS